MKIEMKSLRQWLIGLLFLSHLPGCSTLGTFSNPRTTEQRLSDFPTGDWPVEFPILIHWHKRMIPFVEAQTDADCAFAIGVVHAHLRLGQMELFRRLSAGRLSEAGGPFVVPRIDHLIRVINLQKSAELELARLAPDERVWLEQYVRGLNFFIRQMKRKPRDFWFLNYEPEEWTLVDALRVGRLAAADVNWGSFLAFLPLTQTPGWEKVWKLYIEAGKNSLESFQEKEDGTSNALLSGFSRTGSNSLVISGAQSKKQSALIANDPHLGIFAPNFWLLMGYKSPTYHVMGYMLPGAPVVAVGRNPDIAWGGTYMRGASSHLFQVEDSDVTSVREERIGRRLWFSKSVTVRETAKGPILTDVPGFSAGGQALALNWVGHSPSNEFGAFLAANRAKNWSQFRNAFKDYAVSGLNVTYADRKGNIGLLPAIRQPLLKDNSEYSNLFKSRGNEIVGYRQPLEHPSVFNPKEGFVASANNMPVRTSPPLAFVSGQNDRMIRWKQLAARKPAVGVEDLMRWQLDVFSASAFEFKQYLVLQVAAPSSSMKPAWDALADWDGHYRRQSMGPVIFEMLTWQLAQDHYAVSYGDEALRSRFLASDDWRALLFSELRSMEKAARDVLVHSALAKSLPRISRFANWGEMHVQVVRSPLGLTPLIGSRFTYTEYPADGGSTTINKAAFSPGFERREVSFGAQARHISDLSDPNENYFVMLGGNDGWLDNPHLHDQVELWRKGEYVKLPLTPDEVSRVYSLRKTRLLPAKNR